MITDGEFARCGARQLDFNGYHRQLSAGPGGNAALTSDPDQGDDPENYSQIVRINLPGGDSRWLTPVGERGEYNIFSCDKTGFDVQWLDNQRLAVGCGSSLTVINTTGKPLMRCPIPRSS